MGVSQNEGYPFEVSRNKDYGIWGLYWGPPILGNYQIGFHVSLGECVFWCCFGLVRDSALSAFDAGGNTMAYCWLEGNMGI